VLDPLDLPDELLPDELLADARLVEPPDDELPVDTSASGSRSAVYPRPFTARPCGSSGCRVTTTGVYEPPPPYGE
jgi:hypothetical protein